MPGLSSVYQTTLFAHCVFIAWLNKPQIRAVKAWLLTVVPVLNYGLVIHGVTSFVCSWTAFNSADRSTTVITYFYRPGGHYLVVCVEKCDCDAYKHLGPIVLIKLRNRKSAQVLHFFCQSVKQWAARSRLSPSTSLGPNSSLINAKRDFFACTPVESVANLAKLSLKKLSHS